MNSPICSHLCAVVIMLLAAAPRAVFGAPPIQVSAADPSSAPQGAISLDVIVSGSGFDTTASVDFLLTGTANPGGIAVKRVNVVGSKKLIATIDVAETAVVASFDILVTQSGGRKGKGTSLFAVRKVGSAIPINPAFAVDPNQQYKDRVVTLEADGSAMSTLTGPLPYSPQPRWSPDGRSLLYFDRLSMLLVRMDTRSGATQGSAAVEPYGLPDLDWSNGNVDSCGDLIVFDGGRDLRTTGAENDLFVTDPNFLQRKKLIMSHDLDDALVGNEADPDTQQAAWSRNGRFLAASSYTKVSGSTFRTLILYPVACQSGVDVTVSGEIPLMLPFGGFDHWWNNFTWNASGQYLGMVVGNNSDADLWIADLGDPAQPGYPNPTPPVYRLTGVDRPFGSGPERLMTASFAPASDVIAFVTQATQRDRDDSLYTINAGACIAAIGGTGSISTACATTLVSKGINAYNVDWRPNWPTPLQ